MAPRRQDIYGSANVALRDSNGVPRMGWASHNFGEARGVGASKGVALTTTLGITPLPDTSDNHVHLSLVARLFSTAVVARFAFTPFAVVLKTTDALVAAANTTEYTTEAQDGSTSTDITLSSLGTPAQNDFLFVGSPVPFSGAVIDVDAANSTASVLTVKYWKNDATWTTISATDGTDAAGASIGVDGNVTWTVPTDWQRAALSTSMPAGDTAIPHFGKSLYWTRWEFSGGIDAACSLNSLMLMARSTAYAELGLSLEQTHFSLFRGLRWLENQQRYEGHAGIQGLTDAGTASLIVTAFTNPGATFV